YVYEDDVVLLVPLKLAGDLKPGPLTLKAKLDWLECETKCIKEGANVQSILNVGSETKPSKDAGLLADWQKKLPAPGDTVSPRAWWDGAVTGDMRAWIIEWNPSQPADEADFFPDASDQFEVEPATVKIPADGNKIRLRARVKKATADWPKQISGVLVQQSGAQRLGYEVNLPIDS